MIFLKQNWLVSLLVAFLSISVFANYMIYTKNRDQKNSLESVKVSQDELFEKRQECAKYTSQIEKELKEQDFTNPQTQAEIYHFLKQVFYSPKANSCLYVEQEWTLVKGKLVWESYTLVNVLTKEIITSTLLEKGSADYLQRSQAFEDYIKDYE